MPPPCFFCCLLPVRIGRAKGRVGSVAIRIAVCVLTPLLYSLCVPVLVLVLVLVLVPRAGGGRVLAIQSQSKDADVQKRVLQTMMMVVTWKSCDMTEDTVAQVSTKSSVCEGGESNCGQNATDTNTNTNPNPRRTPRTATGGNNDKIAWIILETRNRIPLLVSFAQKACLFLSVSVLNNLPSISNVRTACDHGII